MNVVVSFALGILAYFAVSKILDKFVIYRAFEDIPDVTVRRYVDKNGNLVAIGYFKDDEEDIVVIKGE